MPEKTVNNHTVSKWLPLIVGSCIAIGIWAGFRIQHKYYSNKNKISVGAIGKFDEVLRYLDAQYVEDIPEVELTEIAIKSVLENLDPHSKYYSKLELEQLNEQREGKYAGVGIEYIVIDDTVVIVDVMENSPASTNGILPRDRIVSVDSVILSGDVLKSLPSYFRGDLGTPVTISLKRPGEEKILSFIIERDFIYLKSVDIGYMINENIGYVKISKFQKNTYKEFMEIVESLKNEHGLENLIIDLRQNPGGYLKETVDILNQLYSQKGVLLVYTEGNGVETKRYTSTGKQFFEINDVAVLIDEGSASGSEILAGAIQDTDRGVVIGRRSFGKGLVQKQFDMQDGSAIMLTVEKYYTPSGRLIQKNYNDSDHEYKMEVLERKNLGELFNGDSIKIADSTIFQTINGRTMFGGGGITPDVFVPIDSIQFYSREWNSLMERLHNIAMKNFEKNWANFKGDFDQFREEFKPVDLDLEGYISTGDLGFLSSNPILENKFKTYVLAYIAKYLYGETEKNQILHTIDVDVQEAINILNRDGAVEALLR